MGDFGHLDQDGYLWLSGRVRELVIRGGQNIVPGEVEDAILAHPHVAEAAVIGVPDAEMGERVCAAVVPRDGVRVTLESITAHLSERGLARFKHPERLFLIDALPLNPAATKVDKRALLEMALGKEIKDSSAEVSQASTRIANRSIRRK
jgi:non-ribosomal peptide synthetase component E (peptide arylation enzyme)